jgi:hypothetical protein
MVTLVKTNKRLCAVVTTDKGQCVYKAIVVVAY